MVIAIGTIGTDTIAGIEVFGLIVTGMTTVLTARGQLLDLLIAGVHITIMTRTILTTAGVIVGVIIIIQMPVTVIMVLVIIIRIMVDSPIITITTTHGI